MENESKIMKDDSSSKPLLSGDMIAIINKGMKEGFEYSCLKLEIKGINDSMMSELCEWAIKLDDKLKRLDLSNNQITSAGVSLLFETFTTNNASLKEMRLNGNKAIDDKCMKSLGEYIKSNKSIEIIWLGDTSISDTGIEILAPYLDGNTRFKELYFNSNQGITDKSIPILTKKD